MSKTLTRDDVIKIAHLSRIKLKESEIEKFSNEINEIIKYIEKLQSVNVDGLKPTDQVTGLKNVWRKDEPIDYGYKPEDIMKNVPRKENGYIKVNRMI